MLLALLLQLGLGDFPRKVVALWNSPEPASLAFRNLSSLSAEEFRDASRRLEADLAARGLKLQTKPDPDLRITLSETPQSLLWVGERMAAERAQEVAITALPRRVTPSPSSPSVTLTRALLFQQNEPILAVAETAAGLLILEPARLALYTRASDATWQLQRALPIPGLKPSRYPRGRIQYQDDAFDLTLQGATCHGVLTPALSLECRHGAQRPFESTGPDSVTLTSRCGTGRQTLATKAVDQTQFDAVQAFEGGSPISPALDFTGPITSLWPEPGGASAIAVSRDLSTGTYAAVRISLSCTP